VNIEDITEWIIIHRTNGAFPYTCSEIHNLVTVSIINDVFGFTLNKENFITGVACGEKSIEKKEIYIHDVLTTQKGAIKILMKKYIEKYPDWKIVSSCRGRPRIISNPTKFERRLK
jgi:hypothetical protein